MIDDEYLTVAEAAEYLKIRPSTLYTWLWQQRKGVKRGAYIASYRIGNRLRFKKADLDIFVNNSTSIATEKMQVITSERDK